MWSVLLLASTVALAPATGSSGADELPLPPMEFDAPPPPPVKVLPLPAAPQPEVRVLPPPETSVPTTVEPVAPPPVRVTPPPPEAPRQPVAILPVPVATAPVTAPIPREFRPPRELSAGESWLSLGHLSLGTPLTALNGNVGALASVAGLLQADRWNYGVGVLTGTAGDVGMTLVGPRGGVTFLEEGPVDLGASVLLGVGAASRGTAAAAMLSLQPELVAQLRLTPWLRASAALSWRFANVWAWSGPSGDALGGPGLSLGLEFGRFP